MSAQLNDAVAPHKRGIPAWWVTIFLFWLGWIFMYADRTVLNPVMGELEKEFGLSGTQLGLMNSVFYFSYALLQVPAGILGDKIGKKKVLIPGFYCSGPLPPSPAGPKAGAPCCSPGSSPALAKAPTTARSTASPQSKSPKNTVRSAAPSSTAAWLLVLRWG
ncbi:D-galactarate permease [Raoultella ornithinolytica]|nr:D-galactarate permease [Raoultella ornithinolytica]